MYFCSIVMGDCAGIWGPDTLSYFKFRATSSTAASSLDWSSRSGKGLKLRNWLRSQFMWILVWPFEPSGWIWLTRRNTIHIVWKWAGHWFMSVSLVYMRLWHVLYKFLTNLMLMQLPCYSRRMRHNGSVKLPVQPGLSAWNLWSQSSIVQNATWKQTSGYSLVWPWSDGNEFL